MAALHKTVKGSYSPRFAAVVEAFEQLIESKLDDGASLAIYQHGEAVVDVYGGVDPHTGRPWESSSVTTGFSTTKGATTICVLQLVDQGLLELEAPVAKYWPEFASAGKEQITVRDVLQHRAALPFLDASAQTFLIPGAAEQVVQEQAPAYLVNSFFNYHPLTFGTILGELIRRVTGMAVGEYFAREVAELLGLEFWIGLPAEEDYRFLDNTYLPFELPAPEFTPEQFAQTSAATQAGVKAEHQLHELINPSDASQAIINQPEFRAAALAGASGSMNARALARMYAAVLGELDGVRLLSPEIVDRASSLGTEDIQRPPFPNGNAQQPPRWGLGFHLDDPPKEPMLGEGSFGHAGLGGRLGFAHAGYGIAFGYVTQRMALIPPGYPDPRIFSLMQALKAVLDS